MDCEIGADKASRQQSVHSDPASGIEAPRVCVSNEPVLIQQALLEQLGGTPSSPSGSGNT